MKLLTVVVLLGCGGARAPATHAVADDDAVAAARWQARMGPATPHREVLARLVGTFQARNRFWHFPGAKPGAPPAESVATVTNRAIYDGRFVVQDYRVPDGSLEGIAYYGFDNLSGHYQYVWLDSAITAITTQTGTFDPARATLTFRGTERDPLTGEPLQVRRVVRFETDSRHVVEVFEQGRSGAEVKSMETVFDRISPSP